jgi:hypothetical protein
MKDGGGENSVRAGKLTGLDHGLSEIEKYIAHLRRKKARGDWGEDDGLRWREVKMKQARMRISLEDTLMQENGENEVERRQRCRLGRRWSTRAEEGWRRIGMCALKSESFRRVFKEEVEWRREDGPVATTRGRASEQGVKSAEVLFSHDRNWTGNSRGLSATRFSLFLWRSLDGSHLGGWYPRGLWC